MILTDIDIQDAIRFGEIIIISEFAPSIGVNSIDLHLGSIIGRYKADILDSSIEEEMIYTEIGDYGMVLLPGTLYLAKTEERTIIKKHVPLIEGLSSTGRLGIDIHKTAGIGSVGYDGHWTLEISVVQPVIVYANMPIAQLLFMEPKSQPVKTYTGNYSNSISRYPEPSMLWKKMKTHE